MEFWRTPPASWGIPDGYPMDSQERHQLFLTLRGMGWEKLSSVRPQPSRRIIGIQDMEGKTRMVAICDYWSQTVLRQVHTFLFRVLKRIPQDMTFQQGGFVDHVRSWGEGTVYYSVDLTKATDRFPLFIIGKVLEPMFGEL